MKRSAKTVATGFFLSFAMIFSGCDGTAENPTGETNSGETPTEIVVQASEKIAASPANDPKTSKSLIRFMGDNPAFIELLDLPSDKKTRMADLLEFQRAEYNRIALEANRKITLLPMEKPTFFTKQADEEFNSILLKIRFQVDEILSAEQLDKANGCFYQILNGLQMERPNIDILAALKLDEKQHTKIEQEIEDFNKYHDRLMERQVAATPNPQRHENQKALILKRSELNEYIQESLSRDQIRRASMLKEGTQATVTKFQRAIDAYKK